MWAPPISGERIGDVVGRPAGGKGDGVGSAQSLPSSRSAARTFS